MAILVRNYPLSWVIDYNQKKMRRSTSVMKLVIYYREVPSYTWSSYNEPTKLECPDSGIKIKEISTISRILVEDKEFG